MSSLVEAAIERSEKYVSEFIVCNVMISTSDLDTSLIPSFEFKFEGKVRDVYVCRDCVILVSTDRLSAFDRVLTSIPWKGSVLNQTSLFWFDQTNDIVPNHVICSPHPNVLICKKCSVFPIEFVMRGYMTGSTSTSIWKNYEKGVRSYCGHSLEGGIIKNSKLPENLLTPTTKNEVHDELISASEVVEKGHMTLSDWNLCEKYSQDLFKRGQEKALEKGLILVDTKYEFGRDSEGTWAMFSTLQEHLHRM